MARLKHRRHERFCHAYIQKDFNASAAARSVGYSIATAGQQGWQLLQKPTIVQRIAELCADVNDDCVMSKEEVLKRAKQLASFDPAELYDEEGKLIPINELDEDVTVNINEMEMETVEVDGQIRQIPVKFKAGRDVKFGLDLMAKYHNLMEGHQKAGAAINTIYVDEKDEQA